MLKINLLNRYKIPVLLMLLSIPNFGIVIGQEYNGNNGIKTAELVVVDSKPSGAMVRLRGLYNFTGRTPFVVPYPIHGKYKIKATKEGYESVKRNVDFVGSSESNLFIKLSPKTRFKAACRSSFVPGWGQLYGGNNVRGIIITTFQIALGVGTLVAIHDYNNAHDDFERALDNFNMNMSSGAYREFQNELKNTEKAYNFRNTMLITTFGFWAYNILDSIIFFSENASQIEFKIAPLITKTLNDKNVMVSWKIKL